MSRHWDPKRGWAGQWDRYRWPTKGRRQRRRRPCFAETAFVVALGLFLGTAYAAVTASPIAWPFGMGAEPGSPAHVSVIDGDTFEHRGLRIRIADIDTPEMRGQCPYERALAVRATRRMRALLAAGPFELHRTGTRDEDVYGRKLRIVTRAGRSLGDMLVAEGLARTWTGRRQPWC
jgi:endonuclease YncB( thermonuclease family)